MTAAGVADQDSGTGVLTGGARKGDGGGDRSG